MDINKVYEEIDRLSAELSRLDASDPNYKPIRENLEGLYKMAADYEKRDQDRINNNIRNDISQDGVSVDMAKVKADRLRSWLDFAKTTLGIGASLGLAKIAYQGEIKDFILPIRSLWDMAKGLIPRR